MTLRLDIDNPHRFDPDIWALILAATGEFGVPTLATFACERCGWEREGLCFPTHPEDRCRWMAFTVRAMIAAGWDRTGCIAGLPGALAYADQLDAAGFPGPFRMEITQ